MPFFTESSARIARASTRRAALLGSVVSAVLGGQAAVAASPLALSCLGCHQPAVDAQEMPALSGMPRARIIAALRRARGAPAQGSIMARFVATLSDAEIERLALELGSASP